MDGYFLQETPTWSNSANFAFGAKQLAQNSALGGRFLPGEEDMADFSISESPNDRGAFPFGTQHPKGVALRVPQPDFGHDIGKAVGAVRNSDDPFCIYPTDKASHPETVCAPGSPSDGARPVPDGLAVRGPVGPGRNIFAPHSPPTQPQLGQNPAKSGDGPLVLKPSIRAFNALRSAGDTDVPGFSSTGFLRYPQANSYLTNSDTFPVVSGGDQDPLGPTNFVQVPKAVGLDAVDAAISLESQSALQIPALSNKAFTLLNSTQAPGSPKIVRSVYMPANALLRKRPLAVSPMRMRKHLLHAHPSKRLRMLEGAAGTSAEQDSLMVDDAQLPILPTSAAQEFAPVSTPPPQPISVPASPAMPALDMPLEQPTDDHILAALESLIPAIATLQNDDEVRLRAATAVTTMFQMLLASAKRDASDLRTVNLLASVAESAAPAKTPHTPQEKDVDSGSHPEPAAAPKRDTRTYAAKAANGAGAGEKPKGTVVSAQPRKTPVHPQARNHPARLVIEVGGRVPLDKRPPAVEMRTKINAKLAGLAQENGTVLSVRALNTLPNGNIIVIAGEGLTAAQLEPHGEMMLQAALGDGVSANVHADVPWHKVQVNRVPIPTLLHLGDMEVDGSRKLPSPAHVKDDIVSNNPWMKQLSWAALPRWMGCEEVLATKSRASIVLAFTSEEDATRVICEGLVVFAEFLAAECYADLARVKVCDNCHHFDHFAGECKFPAKCGICAQGHVTLAHKCDTDGCSTYKTPSS